MSLMIRTVFAIAAAPLAIGPSPSVAAPMTKAQPTVVELFQSQGCSDCPPANANLNAIADRPDVLALSFVVTYWDRFGGKDIFGSPRWTVRRWDYARRAGRREVATPQVVVNGGPATVVGSNRQQLDAAIARAGPPRGGPAIAAQGANVRLGAAAHAAPATVWLVRYDRRVRNVPIRAGENSGRTLPHRDIVRELVKLGDWSGAAESFRLPAAAEPGLSAAVLVQAGAGGPVTAARRL